MITGKEDKSFSVDEIKESKDLNFGATRIVFAHQATAGDKGIDLNNLVIPTEMAANGFLNPNAAELAAAHLSIFRKNLRLRTSGGTPLTQYLDYKVTDAGTINFLGTLAELGAQEGEIFIGEVDLAQANSLVVADARIFDQTISVPDDLAIGSTTVNIGIEYLVNANPNQQTGDIKVFKNGKRIYRNVGNAVADPSADGNYQEIDSGNGYGTTIELNQPLQDGDIIGIDNGLTIGQGDQQIFGSLESFQGILQHLAEDAAFNFFGEGDATRYLSSSPSELERRQFGQTLLNMLNLSVMTKQNSVAALIDTAQNVTRQQENFIQTIVNTPATGNYTVTWAPGFFTVPPVVMASASEGRQFVRNVTTTGCLIIIETSPGVGAPNVEFEIVAHKMGADFTAAKKIKDLI